ncbi:MAG TPA: hypothetical protein VNZ01_06440 [Solirubrobacteraceae bacterium]|jgi:hypothetical protein|nr:hypothetical protein [Solirubrobacteraceae bacterium]
MRSLTLQAALTEFAESAAVLLQADLAAGAEIPFELDSRPTRGMTSTPLYCYRSLTGAFIAERQAALESLPARGEAARRLKGFDGLESYLAIAGREPARQTRPARVDAALIALLQDVFDQQTDFELRAERLQTALQRLEQSALAGAGEVTLVATLHGLTITSEEIQLTRGLTLARPDALDGLPEAALPRGEGREHPVVVLNVGDDEGTEAARDVRDALSHGRAVLADLLRALRLFGDGRVTLGALGWARIGAGAWTPLPIGAGGRPHGMLVITTEQEDELRAFCSLVSRRAPEGNELAWALARFEMGCERETPSEALTDHLLALRALLEPEGPASGLLAGRVAALCATPQERLQLTERIVGALAIERAAIAGGGLVARSGALELVREVGDHLRALLRDVICGHLSPDLVALADELLLEDEQPSGEELLGDAGESEEILDLLV